MSQAQQYEMKDSGVEWIGQIPKGWECMKARHVFQSNKNGIRVGPFGSALTNTVVSSEQGTIKVYGQANLIRKNFEYGDNYVTEETYRRLKDYEVLPNDVAISMMGTIGKCCVVPDGISKGIMDSHLIKVRLNNRMLPRFFEYLYESTAIFEQLLVLSKGSIMNGLNSSIVKRIFLTVPPHPEQEAIAAYLDTKCAAIDSIIAEAKATIEEYKAWKASVIFEAVTKGLNPDAEMKDSGVEWSGKIPQGWEYKPLKHLASCNDEVLSEATPGDYVFDYIDIGSVHAGNGIGICERMQFKDAPSRARRIVRSGDIIVSTVRTYLKAIAQVENYAVPHIASTGFAVIRAQTVTPSFLKYALLSDNFVSQVEADSVGISYPAINASQIVAFKIPVPPLPEQEAIAAYLDTKCTTIDGVIAEKEALIAELESYKKSLIFETVTGKRRVSGLTA